MNEIPNGYYWAKSKKGIWEPVQVTWLPSYQGRFARYLVEIIGSDENYSPRHWDGFVPLIAPVEPFKIPGE